MWELPVGSGFSTSHMFLQFYGQSTVILWVTEGSKSQRGLIDCVHIVVSYELFSSGIKVSEIYLGPIVPWNGMTT